SSTPATCASACSATPCGDACVNTSTDANHCGGCDTACPTPAHGQAPCPGGKCGVVCNMGYVECSGACVVTASDAANCGGCGNECASGTCRAGKCACTGASSEPCGNCGTQSRTCNADGTWSAWSTCSQPAGACSPGTTEPCGANSTQLCSPGCAWGACTCKAGYTLCGSTCINEQTDGSN